MGKQAKGDPNLEDLILRVHSIIFKKCTEPEEPDAKPDPVKKWLVITDPAECVVPAGVNRWLVGSLRMKDDKSREVGDIECANGARYGRAVERLLRRFAKKDPRKMQCAWAWLRNFECPEPCPPEWLPVPKNGGAPAEVIDWVEEELPHMNLSEPEEEP